MWPKMITWDLKTEPPFLSSSPTLLAHVVVSIRMVSVALKSFVIREWHYLTGIGGCDLVGVGVALLEKMCHWGWVLGF